MAGGKLIISNTVKGSTILEVLISMIIILVVFSFGMMIIGNVNRSSLSAKKAKAEAILQEKLLNAEQNNSNVNETTNYGTFQIRQEVQPYTDNSHLSWIHFTAYDSNNEKVAELQKAIINP